ncbi:MAG: VanZ family protein [Thermoclostridium sp.]|nr:VanZ family protein [Thermoclostridium sp.]
MEKRRIMTIAVLTLLFATVAFIWGNSMKSMAQSQQMSQTFMKIIVPFLEFFLGQGNVTEHIVRKLAHFTEFGMLGVELALLLILYRPIRLQSILNGLFTGLVIALSDETIQIFFKRGPQIQDVWLDFTGVAAGLFLVLLIYLLIVRIQKTHGSSRIKSKSGEIAR